MLLTDIYVKRKDSLIMIEHVEENLMYVRFLASPINGVVGLECAITRPNAKVTDELLPQALYFDACLKTAQFLELEVLNEKEQLEQEISISLLDVEVMRIFPLYFKDKDAWGADGHFVMPNSDVKTFSIPVPEKNQWQTAVSSVLSAPILQLTLGPFKTYQDFLDYYMQDQATISINNAREPMNDKLLSAFERRAEAFADLMRKAKEWRPN